MAFSAAELAHLEVWVRMELGYGGLTVTSEPLIGHSFLPQVAFENLSQGHVTTSSTTVASTDIGTPVALTVADAGTLTAAQQVHLDVGGQLEIVVVQHVAGAVLTMRPAKEHSGTYTVREESGEARLLWIKAQLEEAHAKVNSLAGTAGLRSVDKGDVVFAQGAGETALEVAWNEVWRWRGELSRLLLLPVKGRAGAGGSAVVGV